jgi:ferredoxin
VRPRVDREACQGHNRCKALAPELFDVDDLGYSFPLVDEIPDELVERARLAVRNCPERAISLEEDAVASEARST